MPPRLQRLTFAALLLFASRGLHPTARAQAPLTRIVDVRSLSRQDAAKALPVRVRGVVTWRGLRDQMTVQDETSGIWIFVTDARKQQLWATDDAAFNAIRVGDVLDIEGVSFPGGYVPGIMPKTLRRVGEQPLPPARPMDPARFFNGAEDSQRVEVRGVVQGVQPAETGWLLELNSNPGRFTAEVPRSALPDPAVIVDAEVRVTGVAVTRINTRGELTMPRVFSSPIDKLLIDVPAAQSFAAPLVPLDRLLPFRPEPVGPHRLRVNGIVTFALPGKFLYLQEGTSAVRVETPSTEAFHAGDRVEAAGFVDMTRSVGTLVGAQVRKIGTASAPVAVAANPEEIIALNHAAMRAGQLALPHDFDGHLIRFRALLLAVQSSPDAKQPARHLTLQRDEMILNATLHAGDPKAIDALQTGSELEVTGIVQLEYTSVAAPRLSLMPTRLEVVLRSAADVAVVRAPSWWTPERLLGAVAVVAVGFGAALVWAWQLRRQVRRKTQLLATEMSARRDAAVEFQATLRERSRLAANLHDTLLQTMGGIGFQIGACAREMTAWDQGSKPVALLTVARRMLDHSVKELRSSVWALRSHPLQGKALPEALQEFTERACDGQPIAIELRTEGDLTGVPDFVAGNLLLAAQEAVHNALKHAQPSKLTLEVRLAGKLGWIMLVIRDDGVGFVPGAQAGAHQGHFGLSGMRERIERLEGTFKLESAPGRGTSVHLEVPMRTYDESIA